MFNELDVRIAVEIMGLREGVDFGIWPEHEWKRHEDGTINNSAYEDEEFCHSGPRCARCDYSYCTCCHAGPNWQCMITPSPYSRYLPSAWDVARRMGEWAASTDERQRRTAEKFAEWWRTADLWRYSDKEAARLICEAALRAHEAA